MREITVLDNQKSIEYIATHKSSVARFGDGEIDIIKGKSIPYQDHSEDLAFALSSILAEPSSDDFLVCLPDVFQNLERYNQNARAFWRHHFELYCDFYEQHCKSPWYGSTFISRPYIDLVDKSVAADVFAALRSIWANRDILIVEGLASRSGVGNDLFDNAKSVERIICPSRNAFDAYDSIYQAISEQDEDKLVLLMLGPTAKVLAYHIMKSGRQAIDIGHIDSEYEWFQMGATHKVKLPHKHTAEHNWDEGITLDADDSYLSQVVVDLTGELELSQAAPEVALPKDKISVIIPVYNVEGYLARCLDSLLKQTYDNFEVILINDGSTDQTAKILMDYATKDKRLRIFHQKNAGPSAARNFGLRVAEGDYITFIDSDDFVYEEYLEKLHTALVSNGSDISACNFTSFDEKRQAFLFSTSKETYFEKNYTPEEFLKEENNPRHNMFLAVVFSQLKLYKKELFKDLEFPVGKVREDDATIYKLYLRAKQITFINEGPYYYSQRADSLSRTVMLNDIEMMLTNMEERLALMIMMNLDVTEQKKAYLARLEKCLQDALQANQIDIYKKIKVKLQLIQDSSESLNK